jgi:DNA helicase-2/ATP-dependent DNA helicase PcrA
MNILELRPEQQAVIDGYRGGYASISAVPGAGKTTTLSALAAELISRELAPRERVIVVTYQNAAVANFQAAIGQRLAERELPEHGFLVRTLHGLANDIVQLAGYRWRIDPDARVVDEFQADQLLSAAVHQAAQRQRESLMELLVFPSNRPWPDERLLRELAKEGVRQLQQRRLNLRDLRDLPAAKTGWLPFILDAAREYQTALRQQAFLTFDDLVLQAVSILEADAEVRAQLRADWPWLLEDEAQDSTQLQERMLQLIAGPEGNLVRAGDANQAILGSFTDSDIEGFRRWLARPDVQHFRLSGSSRSSPAVIELANCFVEEVRERFPVAEIRQTALAEQPIQPIPGENPPLPAGGRTGLTVRAFTTSDEEQDAVLERALAHLERNPAERVAILVGSRQLGHAYVKTVERRGFPAERVIQLLGGRDSRPINLIDKLLPVLDFLEEPDTRWKFTRVLTAWSPLGPDDRVIQALDQLGPSPESLGTLLRVTDPQELSALLGVERLSEEEERTLLRLTAMPVWLANRLARPHELLAVVAATVEADPAERAALNRVIGTVEVQPADVEQDRLGQLRRILLDLREQRRFLRGTPEEHLIRIGEGTLTVSTRHQAKGLEWDIVFAVGCDDYWFPGSLAVARPNHRDELGPIDPLIAVRAQVRGLIDDGMLVSETDLERALREDALERVAESLRLMYVTITRARRGLWISWHHSVDTGAEQRPRHASAVVEMLHELTNEVQQTLTTSGQRGS